MDKWVYIGHGMAWIATAAAVIVCMHITHRIAPMWFMLIPALTDIPNSSKKEES